MFLLLSFISSEEVKIYQLHCSENSLISEVIYEAFSKKQNYSYSEYQQCASNDCQTNVVASSKEPKEAVI